MTTDQQGSIAEKEKDKEEMDYARNKY